MNTKQDPQSRRLSNHGRTRSVKAESWLWAVWLSMAFLTAGMASAVPAESETVPEFALQYNATGKYYGIYALTNNAPLLNGRGTLLITNAWSFCILFNDQGVVIPCGPFKFKNGEPVQIRQHAFHLVTRGLYDIQQSLAREAASNAAFRAEQQARGLIEHGGTWVSSNELRSAHEREASILTNAVKRQAAIPAPSRCRACGGLGVVQQGVETFGDSVVRRFADCLACQGTGCEPAVAPASTTTNAQPPSAAVNGSAAATPTTPKLTPMSLKKPIGASGSGGIRRLGQ